MLPKRRDQVAYLIYKSINCKSCDSCEHLGSEKLIKNLDENPCLDCASKASSRWRLAKHTANSIADSIEAIVENTPSIRKTTFGQILDLLDKNRESEEEVRLMDATEVSIYGPVNSPFWKPFEDRTVENLGIEDGALEVWFEED